MLLLLLGLFAISSNAQGEDGAPADWFLLQRPLEPVQIKLLGAYEPEKKDELLEALKTVVEEALYESMVQYFVPSDDYQFVEPQENTTFVINGTNATEPQQNNDTTSVFVPPTLKEGPIEESILSKVFIEWTSTNFEFQGDPFLHVLEARGRLGFHQYDYALLHPQVILPLQEKILAGNTTEPMSLFRMELELRRKRFFYQVLQFIMAEEGEDVPTPSPTTMWVYEDGDVDDGDEEELDVEDEDNTNGNIQNDTDQNLNGTLEEDDDDDDEYEKKGSPVGKDAIGTALIVVCTVCVLAFLLFVRFLCFKTNQIKKDRHARKESTKKVGGGKDGIVDSGSDSNDNDNAQPDTDTDLSLNPSSSTSSPKSDVEAGRNTSGGEQAVADENEQNKSTQEGPALNWASIMLGRMPNAEGEGDDKDLQPAGWHFGFCHPNSNSTMSPEKEKDNNSKFVVDVKEEELHDL